MPVNFTALESKVENLSIALSKLPSSSGTTVTSSYGTLTLTGTNTVQNVFNIDFSQFGTQITINVPTTSIVIINVTGTVIDWPSGTVKLPGAIGGSDSDYLFSSNVIWNFYQATSFTIEGVAVEGTVLAPLATFQAGSGGHIAGQVIVREMLGLSTEFHPYYFSGCIIWP